MRGFARQVQAWDDFRIDAADTQTTRHTLRLLAQPVYRYEDAAAGVQVAQRAAGIVRVIR